MNNIYNLTKNELSDFFVKQDLKKYRATQLFEFLYHKKIKSFGEIHNINKDVLKLIKDNFNFGNMEINKIQIDKDLKKYLIKLDDGNYIEAVLMFQKYGNSLCISTQIGCNMNCLFCESGKLKKKRNLEVSEMIKQILLVEDDIKDRVSHILQFQLVE